MDIYHHATAAADALDKTTKFAAKAFEVTSGRLTKLQQGPKLTPESYDTELGKIMSDHMAIVAPHLDRARDWRAQGDEALKLLTAQNFAGATLLHDSHKTAAAFATVAALGAARVAALQLSSVQRDPVLVAAVIVAGESLTGQDRAAVDTLAADHYNADLVIGHTAAWKLTTAPARVKIAAGLGEVHDLFLVEIANERIARLGQPMDPQLDMHDRAA